MAIEGSGSMGVTAMQKKLVQGFSHEAFSFVPPPEQADEPGERWWFLRLHVLLGDERRIDLALPVEMAIALRNRIQGLPRVVGAADQLPDREAGERKAVFGRAASSVEIKTTHADSISLVIRDSRNTDLFVQGQFTGMELLIQHPTLGWIDLVFDRYATSVFMRAVGEAEQTMSEGQS